MTVGFFHGGLSNEVVNDDGWFFQGGLSNEAFEDNFVGDVARLSSSELRDVYRERDELRSQLECATDELRHYKPEYLHAVFSFFFTQAALGYLHCFDIVGWPCRLLFLLPFFFTRAALGCLQCFDTVGLVAGRASSL